VATHVVANMRYGLIPEGPARRARVFGGSNIHALKPEYVDGGTDEMAVKALICMWTSPEWSTRLTGSVRTPAICAASKPVDEGASGPDQVPRRDDIHAAQRHPLPVIPEAPEIMKLIVPDMLQNALTGKMPSTRPPMTQPRRSRRYLAACKSRPALERSAAFVLPAPRATNKGCSP